jgi:hypothetical protein
VEREAGIATPPLADNLARRGRPTGVADDDVEGVAGADVLGDGVG